MLFYRTVAGTHCVWCWSKEDWSMDNVDIVGHGATGCRRVSGKFQPPQRLYSTNADTVDVRFGMDTFLK